MTNQAEKIWKNMNSGEKCQWYQKVKTAIGNSVKKGAEVNIDILRNALLHVRIDFTAKEAILRNCSKELIVLILSSSIKNTEFVIELIKFCQDESTPVDLQNIVKQTPNGLSHRIQKSIVDGPEFFQLNTIFDTADKNFRLKLINTIDELLTEKLPDFTDKFLLDRVLPTLFQPDINKNSRQGLTDLAFKLVPRVPISLLPPKEEEIQIKNVSEKYIQVVSQLRDSGYQDWHNLWILLVRFCHKNIHGSMELANKLLRVVEYAFRNASYQQRLYGYDCWKEFIDNASLDIDHMCSSKQIKLLVTPLKAKFSKMEVVICKRFDVFVYLLEKLQHRAVLCLNEFLEFCFGPLKTNVEVNVSKSGQGKLVSQLWEKCTQVLMALLGHSHDVHENCLSEEIIKLEKPVFTAQNIPTFLDVLIGAISECFVLLKDWCPEAKREVIVKCIWGSLLRLISSCADGKRKVCIRAVSLYLENITTKINSDHIRNIFLCLIDSTLSHDNKNLIDDVLSEEIVDCMLHLLFTANLKVVLAEDITAYFLRSVMPKNKPHYVSVIINQLHESPMTENVETVSKIWLVLEADEFKNVDDMKVVSFLMWPIYHYHLFSEDVKKTITVAWAKIYINLCSDFEENKFSVLNQLEKFFKDNPFRCGNIISFVAIISQFEKTHSPNFVTKFLNLSAYVLTLPTLIREDMLKLSSIILGLFDLSLPFYSTENDSPIIKSLCACIKHILTIHKHYDILELLGNCINTMPKNSRKKFLQPLSDELENLSTHKDKKISKEALTLLSMNLDKEKNKHSPSPVFQLPVSRASKMANMFKEDSVNCYLAQSPSSMANAKTPIKVKGSQLGNTPTSKRAKSIMNNLPKRGASVKKKTQDEDDNTADYIPIDTVVKFQPDKLSEHQREVLKKRKEDIPALYQDLSQSHSQSEDIFKVKGSNSALSPVDKVGITNLSEASEDLIKSEDSLLQIGKNKTSPKKNGKKVEVVNSNGTPESNSNDNRIEIIEENAVDLDKTNQGYASDNSVTSTDTETSRSGKRKKLSKIEVELNRIKMDIVGGDQFFQNLPPKRTRTEKIKSETKEKKKRLSLSKNVKTSPVGNVKGKAIGNKMEPKRLSYPEIEVKMTQDEQNGNTEEFKDSPISVQDSSPVNGSQNTDTPKKSANIIIENKNDVEDCIKYTEENKENSLEKSIEEQLAFLHGENFENESTNKKRKNVEKDSQKFSEDIIESSQESNVTVNSALSSPKKPRLSKEKSIETPVKNITAPESNKFMISQAETLTCAIIDTCDLNFITPTPQINLGNIPDISNSEKLACEMDTVSLSPNKVPDSVAAEVEIQSEAAHNDLNSDEPIPNSPDKVDTNSNSKFDVYTFQDDENTVKEKEENTPEASETNDLELMNISGNGLRTPVKNLQENSLPTSPVTGDTPNKTNELLINTQNISPINSEHNSSDEEKLSQSDRETAVSTSSKIQSSEDQNCEMSNENQLRPKMPEAFRSSRLLQMINIDSPVTTATIPKRHPLHFIISSRGTMGRTRKLMLSALDVREKNRNDETEMEGVETEEDILTFTREVPSPLAVPKSGILKRKLIQVCGDETFSPCAKRKRVNFSDPILTSKKVFIKHDIEDDEIHKADEDQQCEVNVITSPIMPLTENHTEDDESIKNSNELVTVEGTEEIICDSSDESFCSEKDLNSELSSNPGTVESADIINPLLLDYKNPIYPNLIDCDEAVLRVLRKVTSPMFITSLLKDLNSRGIKTVGDLAKLSELEVNRLPFKSPAIQNVYKALDNYYHKKKTKEAKKAAEGSVDENLQLDIISPINSHSNNISGIVEKGSVSNMETGNNAGQSCSPKSSGASSSHSVYSNEKNPENACTDMSLSLTTQDIIKWVGQSRNEEVLCVMKHLLGHCITNKTPIAELFKSNPDIFIKSDMKFLVEQVVATMGLTETVKIVSEISSNEKILNTVLYNRSVEEITVGLKTVVEKDYFKRDELLKSCLPILVKSPDDISFYFSNLSAVELGDVIVNRITAQDIDTFIDQIIKRFGSEAIYNAVDKNDVLELCSSSDLVSVIFKGKETKELINFLEEALKKVDNSESRNVILTDLFKFISSELPLRTLMNLYVDFIKNISERIME